MLWLSDAVGSMHYIESSWETTSGQPVHEALGTGWMAKVHPDDSVILSSFFQHVYQSQEQYSLYFRLSSDACARWLFMDGAPAVSAATGDTIGYVASVKVLADAPQLPHAAGRTGTHRAALNLPGLDTPTMAGLADQVIFARSLAAQAAEKTITTILDLALMEIGFRLAEEQTEKRGQRA